MKKYKVIKRMIYTIFLIILISGNCFSDSLFKEYTEKSRQELMDETDTMSKEIKDTFNQRSVEIAQQKIDFYDYFSNLKKLVLYGSKLATYAEYDQDLKFAKDNELFKGLPDDQKEKAEFTTRFVNEKYNKMQHNVKDEIETYEDLIQISLDSCELLSSNDLSGFVASPGSRQRIQLYFENSKDFKRYLEKRDRLGKTWPDIELRIKKQMALWNEKGMDPEDPIIDRKITEAISREGSI